MLAPTCFPPEGCFALRIGKQKIIHVVERSKRERKQVLLWIPNRIWKGNGNFQTRAAFLPPKYKLENRSLASTAYFIPNTMNFSSEEKVSLVSSMNPLKDVVSHSPPPPLFFWFTSDPKRSL